MRLIDAEPIEKYIENGLNCKDPKKGFGHDAIDILTEIHCAPTICQTPNDPLTLEELREMDGEPVWVQSPGVPEYGSWRIVAGVDTEDGELTLFCHGDFNCRDYGKAWLAYRRKPEEATPKATPDWCDHIKRRFEKVT